MSFAKVAIVGNLGQDPESRYLQSGQLVVSFSMAAQGFFRSGGGERATTWFRVSAFGEQAERLANMVQKGYIAKGRQLYVEGQMEARQYTGNDGQQRTSLDVRLSDWQFIGNNQQNQQGGQGGGNFQNRRNDGDFDPSQGGSQYSGSQYSDDQFGSGDPSDMNDVPF